MFDDLTDKNIDMYAMKVYENPQCLDIEEYYDDIKRIKYIKSRRIIFSQYYNITKFARVGKSVQKLSYKRRSPFFPLFQFFPKIS